MNIKKETNSMIKQAIKEFYEKAISKIKQGGSIIPFHVLKEMVIPDRPKSWSVNALMLRSSDNQLSNYFIQIMDEFDPLRVKDVPTIYSNPFSTVAPHKIARKMRSENKSKSAVSGDVLPQLATKYSDLTAIPTTRIMN